jgi:2-hydroxychromene-2-carboxylate isomerase
MEQRVPGELEFWFDFASNYSYLSVMRIGELARRANVQVHWRPFLLGPIFQSFGWQNSPFVLQKEKGNYVWQDMVRECRKYGLPWRRPAEFPRNSVLAARIGVHGAGQPWMEEFCRQVMLRNFAAGLDIATEADNAAILDGMGLDAPSVIAAAQSSENKLRLRECTALAKARGVFGAPTFFVGDEMFWGNDRLEDALAAACQLHA